MADDPVGLADAVAATLTDPASAERRAVVARRVAEAHRSDRVGGALDAFWQRARASNSTARPR